MRTIDVFMRRIVDYAGLFPPARLPLDEALRNFREYGRHAHADFLGRFVLPAGRAREVDLPPSSLSLLVPEGEFTCPAAASIETPWQGAADFPERLEAAFPAASRIFIELDWRKPPAGPMDRIARGGARLALKLRTGGVTADAIPPASVVADFLLAAAERRLPLKASAGLHVPVPNSDPTVGARLHGFLNFFCAGFLAYTGRGGRDALVNALDNFGHEDFHFTADSLRCGGVEFSRPEVERLRSECLLSFGSCSFLEPVEHLSRRGLI